MMTLQQFRMLIAVRDHRSLTAAAESLQYGVPTVTHHLRNLEAHLQAQLIESSRAGTRLTPLGESFAAEIAQVLERIDRAERMIADQRDAGVVTLRVGTFASIGSRLLPAAIAELQQRSSVRVEVAEAEPTDVVRMIRENTVHAGIIYDVSDTPMFNTPDLTLDRLLAEPFKVMVAKSGPLAAQDRIDLADLGETPWILSRSDNEASDRVLRRAYLALGREARPLTRTDDLYMIHGLVEKGLGCALTTDASVDTDFDVVLRSTAQDLGERNVFFVMRRDDPPPAAVWLRDILRASALTLGRRG